ncbi:MAG: acyl carrier protein [Deltaproteobacteria bacterium]|nr:acyl carrier protein [Deltaproteobacteria bacterium]
MDQNAEGISKSWTREEVEKSMKEILIDALGVEEEKIVPEASLVHDLGAESIDFLDVSFRVQQAFGVELPNRAIQDKVLSWRNLGELRRILQERYGVILGLEEVREFHTRGILKVLQWLAEKQGITIGNGDAEKVAGELVDCLARDVESLGFRSSLIDREGIIKVLLEDLNSPKIIEAMGRFISVGAIVDYITARVGGEGHEVYSGGSDHKD